MKKAFALTLSIVMVLSVLFSFASCGGEKRSVVIVPSSSDNSTVPADGNTINIYLNEGGGITATENTEFNDIISMVPTKEGYDFAGWYSDSSFTDYIKPDGITKTQLKKGTAYAKWIFVETKTYNVREEKVTITDSGRKNQQLDKVGYSSDYSFKDLLRAGYKKLTITVSFDVSEKNEGYQYFFIYSTTSCADNSVSSILDVYDKYVFGESEEDPSLCYAQKFEHNPGTADSSWNRRTFEFDIDISRFSDDIYLRYGASGKDEDTWYNQNVVVSVTPIK